ncbi:MAG: hypothetical protein GY869_29190, partial [Planctomycetes bacterium]|nr:hypothetical protein [Planctomycetota bacterium]
TEDIALDQEMAITVRVAYSAVKEGSNGVYTGDNNNLHWQQGNIESEPDFAFDKDYHLMKDSLCIDTGTNSPLFGLPTTDAQGNPRILDGNTDGYYAPDMGVYEHNPQTPTIALSTELLQYQHQQNRLTPEQDTISIRNCGTGALSWQTQHNCLWLKVNPSTGFSQGEIDKLTLTINSGGLPAGKYQTELMIINQENPIDRQ